MKTHSGRIAQLEKNEIFVFGSNEAGYHGAGAARLAHDKFGAKWGKGVGFEGQTYALPTKDYQIESLPLNKIQKYVDYFIDFARNNKHMTFMLTEVGCGLAGFTVENIAPMFVDAIELENIVWPETFKKFYEKMYSV